MFDFPSSPSTGQVYQPGVGLPVWQYDGTVWKSLITGQGVRPPTQTVVLANTTYTPPAGCTHVQFEGSGGGGGGGGATGGASTVSAAAGGASGVFGKTGIIPVSGGSATITIGAAGAGAAAGASGGNGGTTTIVYGGVTYTLPGGAGGTGISSAALGSNYVQQGGNPMGVATNFLNWSCIHGGDGFITGVTSTAYTIKSGQGGSSPYGVGGNNQRISGSGWANGYAAAGYGCGGGGGLTWTQATGGAGGAATPGIVIVNEYYMGDPSGMAVPGVYRLGSGDASGLATLDIPIPPGYMMYDLALTGIVPVTNAVAFLARFSSDGVNFDATSSYAHAGNASLAAASPSNAPQGVASSTAFTVFGAIGNATRANLFCRIPMHPQSAAQIMWQGFYWNGSSYYHTDGGGIHVNMANPVKAIRFLMGSGNFSSGTWQLNGWK